MGASNRVGIQTCGQRRPVNGEGNGLGGFTETVIIDANYNGFAKSIGDGLRDALGNAGGIDLGIATVPRDVDGDVKGGGNSARESRPGFQAKANRSRIAFLDSGSRRIKAEGDAIIVKNIEDMPCRAETPPFGQGVR